MSSLPRNPHQSLMLRAIGLIAVLMAVLSVAVSIVSGIGVIFAVSALVLSGVSSIGGTLRYAWITGCIVSLTLCCVSVLPQVQSLSVREFLLLVGIPYAITFVLIGIGLFRRKKRKMTDGL